jgi:hypothetical protein
MEEHEEYGAAPRSTFCVLLRSTHLQEYFPLPRSTFYLGGAPLATLVINDPWILGANKHSLVVQLEWRTAAFHSKFD